MIIVGFWTIIGKIICRRDKCFSRVGEWTSVIKRNSHTASSRCSNCGYRLNEAV